jgi:glycerate kinase
MSEPARRVLLAPDKFKGTMGAALVAGSLAQGFEALGWSTDRCPLGDGGEGTAEALLAARGGEWETAPAHDPLGRPIEARWALLGDGTAVVEVAAASGLALLSPDRLDPIAASTAGTGELISAAARRAEVVLVAAGGSATTDGGAGALASIEAAGGLGETRLICLCDVTTPWELAAASFAPQKGADADQIEMLGKRLAILAAELAKDPRGVAMGGAAGGLTGGLWAEHDAKLIAGAGFVLDAVAFNARAAEADLVVTGEGRLDETTLEGKLVAEVARRCGLLGVPVRAVVGEDALDPSRRSELGLASVAEAGSPARLASVAASLG